MVMSTVPALPGSEDSKQRGPNPSDASRPGMRGLSVVDPKLVICCLLVFLVPPLSLGLWLSTDVVEKKGRA